MSVYSGDRPIGAREGLRAEQHSQVQARTIVLVAFTVTIE